MNLNDFDFAIRQRLPNRCNGTLILFGLSSLLFVASRNSQVASLQRDGDIAISFAALLSYIEAASV
jgi:hypothetical protein